LQAQNTAKENKCMHTTTLDRIMAPHAHTHAIVAFIPRKLATLQMKTNKKHRKKDMAFIREKEAIQVNSLKPNK
jgi:hypothetical protein